MCGLQSGRKLKPGRSSPRDISPRAGAARGSVAMGKKSKKEKKEKKSKK